MASLQRSRSVVFGLAVLALGSALVIPAESVTISDPIVVIDGAEYILQPNLPPPPPPPPPAPPTGSVSGFVRDAAGVPVVGATVAVLGGPAVTTAVDGGYTIPNLLVPSGAYTVTASLPGWGSSRNTPVTVADGVTTAQDLKLNTVVGGGLTSAEKQSVQWLIWAADGNKAGDAGAIHDGMINVFTVVRDQTNADTRAAITLVLQRAVQAQYEINKAVSLLLGSTNVPGVSCATRAACVTAAKSLVNTTKTVTLPSLNSAIDDAIAAGAVGTYPFTMSRYKTINVAGAIAKLGLFNTTLAYTDPNPPARSPLGDRVTVIGPHGDYSKVVAWLTTAFTRSKFMYDAAIAGYAGGGTEPLLTTYNNKYQQLKFSSLIVQKIGVVLGTAAGMQFSGYPTDPFFRVLMALEVMSHGGGGPVTAANDCLTNGGDSCHAISYDFNNMKLWTQGDAGDEATRPILKAAQATVISEVTETWQATDTGAIWYFMKFPECDTTGGCGGTGS